MIQFLVYTYFFMEPTYQDSVTNSQTINDICLVCHQTILPEYYFCPNCGTKIHLPPLATTLQAQIFLYGLSIILPSLCFLFIKKWDGVRYLQSSDQKPKTIGAIACVLLVTSTILTFWYAYSYTQQLVQSSIKNINSSMDGY